MSVSLHESRFTMMEWGFRNDCYSGFVFHLYLYLWYDAFQTKFWKQVPCWLWALLEWGFRFRIMEMMIKGISLPPFDNHNLCSCLETTQGINKLFHWLHAEIWLWTEATMPKLESFREYLNLIRWSVQLSPLPKPNVNDV